MTSLLQKARTIKLLALDVDGVLTDGRLHFDETKECSKTFHVHDGLGIKLLLRTAVTVAIISSRSSLIVARRAQELGITQVYQGVEKKWPALQQLLSELQLTADQVAYAGDDLPDLPIFRQVGLAIAVANAVPALVEKAHWQTRSAGGHGAVREICEFIMRAQGTWESVLAAY